MGEVKGVNTESLEAVTVMDNENTFYFVSNRSGSAKIYLGIFKDGEVSNIKLVSGNINDKGEHVMGSEVSPDGETLYFVTDLREIWVANKVNGEFIVTDNSQYIPKNIIKPKIYRATRNNISEPFGVPVIIDAVVENEEVFVEVPTITGDEKTLYYHKKEGGKFSIFKVTRDEVTSKRYPPRRILWLINIWIL